MQADAVEDMLRRDGMGAKMVHRVRVTLRTRFEQGKRARHRVPPLSTPLGSKSVPGKTSFSVTIPAVYASEPFWIESV
jgi:hypothetical protein